MTDSVISYADLIEAQEQALLAEYCEDCQSFSSDDSECDCIFSYAEVHVSEADEQELTQLIAVLENDPFSPLWGELIDTFGEGRLMDLGADL